MVECAWTSEPDGPGLWWRDDRDGMPAHVVTVVSHGGALMLHVVDCLLPLPIGRRWARCVPPTAEILAPGEPSRTELRAQAWREGAAAMREAVLDHLPCVTAERDECAARIHRVSVPPCPEVSR